jgi:aromatic-amino-acid transaminase
MFETLSMAPPDPILGLTEAFREDPRREKINLGVGIYKDETGATPVFSTVKKAEKRILEKEATKNYLPIPGPAEYGAAVQELVLGAGSELVKAKRVATAQTPGGTGALRVAGDFLKKVRPGSKVWVSDPTWENHIAVFNAAGFETGVYPYYDPASKGLNFAGMSKALAGVPESDIVLLHACCHNPTGIDPALEQWREIAAILAKRNLFPLIDFAYQGLGDGLEEDAGGVRSLCSGGREMLIASSFSKNFGLYNERVGALTVVGASADVAAKAFSHIKIAIRRNYSNPPAHGGTVVTTILNDPALRQEWVGEVAAIRNRIREMRDLFVKTLKAKGVKQDFSFITRQKGMFSFSGLNKDQVAALRDKHAIYIVGSGRINVAGMTKANMDQLCTSIAAVL